MFSVHTTPEEFKNAAIITGQFGFVYEGIVVTPVEKLRPFWKCFPSTLKREAGVFKFLRFEERFRNDQSVLVWTTVGKTGKIYKAEVSNFSCVVWKRSYSLVNTFLPEHTESPRANQVATGMFDSSGTGFQTKVITLSTILAAAILRGVIDEL